MTKPVECTLLDLMQSVNEYTENDQEVAATVASLVNSGRVRLRGNFAWARIKLPSSLAAFPKELWPIFLGMSTISPQTRSSEKPLRLAA